MVKIYATDIRNLPDPKEQPKLLNGLNERRKTETMKFLQASDRKRSLGAGILLQEVLTRYGISPKRIYYEAHGKPAIEGLCFNLSHSGDLVLCAVGHKSVGCDVEKIAKAPMRVAERFFREGEVQYLKEQQEEERNAAFFRLWTMKESYMKMTGEGMSLSLNGFELLFKGEEVRVRQNGKILSCHIREYEVPGYKISVCAKEEQFAADITYIL